MVRVLANGSIRAGFARTSATGVQTVFGTDVTIRGLTYAAGDDPQGARAGDRHLTHHGSSEGLEVDGHGARGLDRDRDRLDSWAAGGWAASASSSYLGSSATNAPIKARYDNLRAVVASTLP